MKNGDSAGDCDGQVKFSKTFNLVVGCTAKHIMNFLRSEGYSEDFLFILSYLILSQFEFGRSNANLYVLSPCLQLVYQDHETRIEDGKSSSRL